MGKRIIQFGMIRSGSTLIYNILKELFNNYSIIKTHHYPSKLQRIQNIPVVCTFRDPLDIICSSIKRNQELPSREVIKKHINVLEKYGFVDFIKLQKNYKNKINLRYENFYNNYDYVFEKLETFFAIKIPKNFRCYLVNKFSINNVKEEIKKFNNFQEFDPSTKFHGLHISDKNGAIKSYIDFFKNEDIKFLEQTYREFREKYILEEYDKI